MNLKITRDLKGRTARPKINFIWLWVITIILITGSVRGMIVLNTDLSPKTIYTISSIFLLLLACFGFVAQLRTRFIDIGILKYLLAVNLILGFTNIVIDYFFGVESTASVLFLFLAPYSILLFLYVPIKYINFSFIIISVLISYSVCDYFYASLYPTAGLENLKNYNLMLRPDTFTGLGRTGEYFRSVGYTGSYHDSANILGMAACFYYTRYLISKNLSDLAIFLLVLLSMTLTQSATNIIAAGITIIILSMYISFRIRSISNYAYFFLGGIIFAIFFLYYGQYMSIFTQRIGVEGDWTGMMSQLSLEEILNSIPYFLLGHAEAFSAEAIHVEVSIFKIIFQLGIVHSALFFVILSYPFWRLIKFKLLCAHSLPYIAVIIFGILSLLHYGSLLRSTSVFIFFAIYAASLNEIRDCRKNKVRYF
jgi:hypothetical protein